MENVQKFNGKAKIYEKYRPSYPHQFIEYLYSNAGFKKDSVIADIGSGTGILSRQLLKMGSRVICVEPNENMRSMAEDKLCEFDNFISVNGTDKNTTISDGTVDFVTVAQAFHWFDAQAFKKECQRILKPHGKVVLVWNSRVINSELVKENGLICERLCLNFKASSGGREENPDSYSEFFNNGVLEVRRFENNLVFNLESFIGRNLSASYAPKENDKNYKEFIDEITNLYNKYSIDGVLTLPNITRSYVGEV